MVDIVKKGDPGGWTVGRLRTTGRLGSFPTDFVEFVSSGLVGPAPLTSQQRTAAVAMAAAASSSDDPFAGLDVMPTAAKPIAAPTRQQSPPRGAVPQQAAAKQPARAAPGARTMVRALFDYKAADDTEISFKRGDTFPVFDQAGDWWEGENGGRRGTFPSNYVELVPGTAAAGAATAAGAAAGGAARPAQQADPFSGLSNETKRYARPAAPCASCSLQMF